jgi:hypothetical protein
MNTKQLLKFNPATEYNNFVKNGNFHNWLEKDVIKYDGEEPLQFANHWFGRRGGFAPGLIVSRKILEGTNDNFLRVAREVGNDNSSEIGIAQILHVSNECYLPEQTVTLSMDLRAGAGYSNPTKQLFIRIFSSVDDKNEKLNPFFLGQKSQTIGLIKATLKQEFNHFSLIIRIPSDAKQIMLSFRTSELSDSLASTDDFFDLMNVRLAPINDALDTSRTENLIPIVHVASMARSGETVFLRSLNAHPLIYNLVNLEEKDNNPETDLFRFLQHYRPNKIDVNHPLMEKLNLTPNQTLLVKQGVWEHKYPFNGIVLVRNPISVYASMISYNGASSPEEFKARKQALTRNCKRWLKDIDNNLLDSFSSLNAIEQFCTFYNRRMYPLSQLGLPIVHYEEFCLNPEPYLKKILSYFSLKYNKSVTQSHLQYSDKQTGHGLINLAEPINVQSLDKWKKHISQKEFNIIAALTYNTCQAFGYELSSYEIFLKNSHKWISE